MPRPADRVTALAATVAVVLGLGSAGVSAYWALGGEGLLDTVGGEIERWAREGGGDAVVSLWLIAALKALVAVAAPILAGAGVGRIPAWTTGRGARILGWVAAVTLTAYGGVLTIAGLLVDVGLIEASEDADPKALTWHTYLWDPWFAAWGIAMSVALWRSRSRSVRRQRGIHSDQ